LSAARILAARIAEGSLDDAPMNARPLNEIAERFLSSPQAQATLAPATESGVCGMVDGDSVLVDASRTDSLRALGNSVVAIQGAAAIRQLLRRIECR